MKQKSIRKDAQLGNPNSNQRVSELEKMNADLLLQLEQAKKAGGKQASCCTIF